jgi:hypothetical protein
VCVTYPILVLTTKTVPDSMPLFVPMPLAGASTWYAATSTEPFFAHLSAYLFNLTSTRLAYNATSNKYYDSVSGNETTPIANADVDVNFDLTAYLIYYVCGATAPGGVQINAVGEQAIVTNGRNSAWHMYDCYGSGDGMGDPLDVFTIVNSSSSPAESYFATTSYRYYQGMTAVTIPSVDEEISLFVTPQHLVSILTIVNITDNNICGYASTAIAYGNSVFEAPSILIYDSTVMTYVRYNDCDISPQEAMLAETTHVNTLPPLITSLTSLPAGGNFSLGPEQSAMSTSTGVSTANGSTVTPSSNITQLRLSTAASGMSTSGLVAAAVLAGICFIFTIIVGVVVLRGRRDASDGDDAAASAEAVTALSIGPSSESSPRRRFDTAVNGAVAGVTYGVCLAESMR